MSESYIVDAVRTPRSRKKGKYQTVHPVDLLSLPLQALVERNDIAPESIEDVIAGCVTQAGEQSWCIARGAILAAGWPDSIPGATVNRLCGSGQQAVNFISSSIKAGTYELAIGGGVEHMTRAPMFSDTGGEPSPGIERHYPGLVNQGLAAEILAREFSLSREAIDTFALESQLRAARALSEGYFEKSLIPVPYTDEQGNEHILIKDDTVRGNSTIEGLASLNPVFDETGVITAGNASAIVDGAAALLLASDKALKHHNLSPRARIVATQVVGSPPKIMLTGPIAASRKVLARAGLSKNDIDLWEINEAFAPVPLAVMQELDLPHDRVNVNGGGISLGHPLGATGAMLLGTALDELERTDGTYALITMCIGLGMGIATIIERV